MAATWTLMALLGLGIVFELFPAVYVAARIAGAAYLLYLGVPDLAGRIGTGRGAWGTRAACLPPRLSHQLWSTRSRLLFAAAVLVAVFPAGIGAAASLVIVVNHFLVEVAFYAALALCLNTPCGCQALHAGQGVPRSLHVGGSRSARTAATLEPCGCTVGRSPRVASRWSLVSFLRPKMHPGRYTPPLRERPVLGHFAPDHTWGFRR